MIQVVNLFIDHPLIESWGILLLSIPDGGVDKSYARCS